MIVTGGLVGFSLLGGRKFATQYMNLFGIKQYLIALFPLAIIVLVFPMALPGANFSTGQSLLVVISATCTAFSCLFRPKPIRACLFMSMKTTATMTTRTTVNRPPTAAGGIPAAALLVAVIAVTKMNANPLETLLTSMNALVAFTGFLVALLILSPEGLGALKAVLNNQVQRAMNLFFGSVLATISLTVPVVTLIAFLTGNELRFGLGAPEMVVMVAPGAVPYLLLHRTHQCAERRGPHGAVRRLSDDHFRLTPLSHPAESGNLPVLTPAGFYYAAYLLVSSSSKLFTRSSIAFICLRNGSSLSSGSAGGRIRMRFNKQAGDTYRHTGAGQLAHLRTTTAGGCAKRVAALQRG